MLPFLTYPLALIALAAVPALAAIYFLRNRFRRRQVSSLMLWQFQLKSKEGGPKIQRLQLPLLFFLELLALVLLVTAATGPNLKLAQATRPMIVVLDDSFSMRAVADGKTAQSRARQELKDIFESQPPPSTRLVLAGTEPRLLGAPVHRWTEVEMVLQQWTCQSPGAAIESALALAAELGRGDANILVLTDGKPPAEDFGNDRIRWISSGTASPNLAVVNAARSVLGEEDRCLIEIANLSDHPAQTTAVVEAGTNGLQQKPLLLGPQERQRLVFNIPRATGPLRVSLAEDALVADNDAVLLPPVRRRVRVQVALTNSPLAELVERTLDATGLRAALSANPDLVLNHSHSSAGSNAWSLRWNIPAAASAYAGPFIIDNSHPVAEGVHLNGVVWAAAPETNSPGEVPVILAGNVPLLSVRDDLSGRRFLSLNLAHELSTLSATPDWPILFWNLLQWRASELPGLRVSNVRLGTPVLLKTAGESVSVIAPDGLKKNFPRTGGEIAIDTPSPGIYSVVTGTTTNFFSVNTLAGDESDLRQNIPGKWGAWSRGTAAGYEQSPIGWLFAVAALGLLAAHLWLIQRGKGRTV